MNAGHLAGKHVVVVGGSSGIGLELARLALASSARVTIGARKRDSLDAAASSLPSVATYAVDVTRPAEVDAMFAAIGTVDHLVFTAGTFVGGTGVEGDLDAFRGAIEARIWGALNVVRAARPRLSTDGSVTLTGGVSTDRPVKGAFISAVGTAAAEQMARVLALELSPVRVNAVSPGWTDTPMWRPILGSERDATFARVGATLPVGRIATAAEVASAALFLIANGAVTGEILHVDGGHRLV